MREYPKLMPPRAVRRRVRQVCAADVAWFDKHPGVSERERGFINGEIWPMKLHPATVVLVKRPEPNVLARLFIQPDYTVWLMADFVGTGESRLFGFTDEPERLRTDRPAGEWGGCQN